MKPFNNIIIILPHNASMRQPDFIKLNIIFSCLFYIFSLQDNCAIPILHNAGLCEPQDRISMISPPLSNFKTLSLRSNSNLECGYRFSKESSPTRVKRQLDRQLRENLNYSYDSNKRYSKNVFLYKQPLYYIFFFVIEWASYNFEAASL